MPSTTLAVWFDGTEQSFIATLINQSFSGHHQAASEHGLVITPDATLVAAC